MTQRSPCNFVTGVIFAAQSAAQSAAESAAEICRWNARTPSRMRAALRAREDNAPKLPRCLAIKLIEISNGWKFETT